MTPFIAIDPGANTGVAWCRADGSIHHETWRLGDHPAQRLLNLYDNLATLHQCEQFTRIGYERPFHGRYFDAVRALHHHEAVILVWARRTGIPALSYSPDEIKASCAGGRATKDRMIQTMRWLGYAPANEHEADALALLLMMKAGQMPAEKARKDAKAQGRKRVNDLVSMAQARAQRRAV